MPGDVSVASLNALLQGGSCGARSAVGASKVCDLSIGGDLAFWDLRDKPVDAFGECVNVGECIGWICVQGVVFVGLCLVLLCVVHGDSREGFRA